MSLDTASLADGGLVCLDEIGPESAKRIPGSHLVRREPGRAASPLAGGDRRWSARAGLYLWRLCADDGAALTVSYPRRTTAHVVDFLEQAEAWLDPTVGRVDAVLNNLSAQRAIDGLRWAVAHPRWEFVIQPTYAASLNLIAPWWKVLRSLALKGRRFATWDEICHAVSVAAHYWNAHRHPCAWGQRKHHRAARSAGIACLPAAA